MFISYAKVDKELADKVVDILRSGGHDPWYDYGLMPGQDWKDELGEQIAACDGFVYALTPESVASEWCQWEFAQAVEMGKPIVPVLLKANTRLPDGISDIQYADFSAGFTSEATAKLIGGIYQLGVIVPKEKVASAPGKPEGVPALADIPLAEFDPPIGTAAERLSAKVWPGDWIEVTGYATFFMAAGEGSYHTGADLSLPGDADKLAPVYAPAPGLVTFSGESGGTWGWLIAIRHGPLADGTQAWSRLAHVTNPMVRQGDRVERGQQIASVGNAEGQLPHHLHFDIACTNVLESDPGHDPRSDLDSVRENYVDPKKFITAHRPPGRA